MDQKTAAELIQRIEKGMDVTALTFQGVLVWPLVRQRVWGLLVNPERHGPDLPGEYRRDVRFSFGKDTRERLERAGRCDALFLSRPMDNVTLEDLGTYNKIIDPVMEALPKPFTGIKLEPGQTPAGPDAGHPAIPLDIRMTGTAPFPEEGIEGFDELAALLADNQACLPSRDAVIKDVLVVLAYQDLYGGMLDMLRPGAVFTVCYNHPPMNGLMRACRQRGIRSVDLQHGKQGAYHSASTHWTTFPKQGWDMLPTHFWCWGEPTRKDIEVWSSQARNAAAAPRVLVGGFPWLAKWTRGAEMDHAPETLQAKELVGGRTGILVTLQPLWDDIPSKVLQAMRHAPPDWFWLIRAHPKQLGLLERFEGQLACLPRQSHDLRAATSLPLLSLLKASRCHATAYSSCCVEALQLGIPSVLWDERGAVVFRNHLEQGVFLHAPGPDDIVPAIQRILDRTDEVRDPFGYIEQDPAVAQAALNEILHTGDHA